MACPVQVGALSLTPNRYRLKLGLFYLIAAANTLCFTAQGVLLPFTAKVVRLRAGAEPLLATVATCSDKTTRDFVVLGHARIGHCRALAVHIGTVRITSATRARHASPTLDTLFTIAFEDV